MIDLLATLVVCITVVYVVERLVRLAERLPSWRQPPERAAHEPMPDDLYVIATSTRSGSSEMDGILHDQTLGAMREAYVELGDWQKVRQRFA